MPAPKSRKDSPGLSVPEMREEVWATLRQIASSQKEERRLRVEAIEQARKERAADAKAFSEMFAKARAEDEARRKEDEVRRQEDEVRRQAEAKALAKALAKTRAEDEARRQAEAKAFAEARAKEAAKQEAADARRREEFARQQAVAAREMRELDASLKRLSDAAGGYMTNGGHILENAVRDALKRRGGVGRIKGRVIGPLQKIGEYDGAVLNGRATVLLEVKRGLRADDVRKFVRKTLPRFVKEWPDLTAKRKVYGALAFQLADDETRALARESGLMLLQVGERKGVKVLNPDPSKLRPLAG